ncbi:MAG TPA: ABC transporter permease [Gemmatimonadaceae bacterium]|nr:ABC transporter permease [Gemmatimonadaceae bacterium]
MAWTSSVRSVRFLLRKEFLQILRDKVMLRQLMIMPVVQLLLLSAAATFEVRNARLFTVDHDGTASSRAVADRLVASGRFEHVGASPSMARADTAMLEGDVDIIVRIPAGFERDLVRDRRATLQTVLNAEDAVAAGVTQGYVGEVLNRYSAELRASITPSVATIGAGPELPPVRGQPQIEIHARGWYNTELQYRDYMIPGILVQLITIVGTLLTAMNIVREKEAGTLDQLNVTPIGRGAFIAAKLLPLWFIALVEMTLGLLVAWFIFDVPIRGSLLVVYFGAAIYLVAALGIGLWVSAIVETQQQAMFITFFIVLIYLLMSGLFTPMRSMPDWAQWMAHLNPVMYFTRVMRAVLLRGAGFADVIRDIGVLALMGAIMLTLAVRQYAKRAA